MDAIRTHRTSFISKNYAFSSIVAEVQCHLTCKMGKVQDTMYHITEAEFALSVRS